MSTDTTPITVATEAEEIAAGKRIDALELALEAIDVARKRINEAEETLSDLRAAEGKIVPEFLGELGAAYLFTRDMHKTLAVRRNALQDAVEAYYEAHPEPEEARA